jgi:NAD(P)-dependent dehydrogenase (short-subunit alcohol dehydrogenase family)
MLLQNKVIVITGGAGVLGESFSRALAAQGGKLAIIGRNGDKAQALADDIVKNGGTAIGLSADVCSIHSLEEAHAVILEKLGKADILINGAGGNHPDGVTADEFYDRNNPIDKDFFGLTPEGIRYVMDLNYMGSLLPTQVFAKDMMGRPDCCIVNISSMSAFNPLTKVPAYSAAKAAISNFTQWLAIYFAKEGIRVNALAPGFFITEQNRTLLTNTDGSFTARGEKILRNTPMGRFGNPDDLTSTLLWLCDPASRFVTGITVPVDGGFSAYKGV